jgi:DNA repair protein RadC
MIVATARHAADLCLPLFAASRAEKVAVLHLAADRRLIAIEEQGEAASDAAPIIVGAILAAALRRDSRGLVLAHNHPSGDPRPSAADIRATRRLARAAAEIGVRLHDHLIFAGGDCRSFRALGLI